LGLTITAPEGNVLTPALSRFSAAVFGLRPVAKKTRSALRFAHRQTSGCACRRRLQLLQWATGVEDDALRRQRFGQALRMS